MAQNQPKPKPQKPRVQGAADVDSPEKQPYPVNNQVFKMGKHEDLMKNNVPIHAFPSRALNMKTNIQAPGGGRQNPNVDI